MHTKRRRATGASLGAVPLLTCLLAAGAPRMALAQTQFGSPPGPAADPNNPAPGDKARKAIVGERADSMLRPDDISRMMDLMGDAQRATAYPTRNGKPLPVPRRLNIAYAPAPSRAPEELHLWQGIITSLTFLDDQGRPWPIEAITYDQRLFSINGGGCVNQDNKPQSQGAQSQGAQSQGAEEEKDRKQPSTFFVVPCKYWTWGSFAVQLRGQSIPVTFMATSGGGDPAHEANSAPFVDAPVVLTVSKAPAPAQSPPAAAARRPVAAARHGAGQEATR